MTRYLSYFELISEEGEDGGRNDPSAAAAVDTRNGDQLVLVGVVPVCAVVRRTTATSHLELDRRAKPQAS